MNLFAELSLVMVFVLIVSMIMQRLKQPLLIGYILTGLLIGPLFFNILSTDSGYHTFAHIGVALLLFIVGLHLNIKLVKDVGVISLITGLSQVAFTTGISFFLIHYILGFPILPALFIAVGLAFSSTIIIVKLLSDKKDIDTLYGRISMGFLIVQDFLAVILLMFIASFLSFGGENISGIILKTLFFGIFAVILTIVMAKYVVPRLLEKISKSQELLFVFVIAWCFGFATLFEILGFSIEIGALIAGITLASTNFQHEISSKIRPLRDFFLVIFFILLGVQMVPDIPVEMIDESVKEKISFMWDSLKPLLGPAIILSLIVLIGNPIIVFTIMSFLGYSSKNGFLAGLTVAQISEFSLILAIMAQNSGFLGQNEVSILTLIAIFTITGSTYMIMHGEELYSRFEKFLKRFEKKNLRKIQDTNNSGKDILIFGYDRIGFSLLKKIEKLGDSYLIIDYDPQVIKRLKSKNIPCIYGDVSNIELLESLGIENSSMIISTIPEKEVNLLILEEVRKINKGAMVILTANHIDHAMQFYEEGADYVILPHFLGGEYVATLIEKFKGNMQSFLAERLRHMHELRERRTFGHEHPKK